MHKEAHRRDTILTVFEQSVKTTMDPKQDDSFNTTWWPVVSTDKCCQVTSLSIEIIYQRVLLKASRRLTQFGLVFLPT